MNAPCCAPLLQQWPRTRYLNRCVLFGPDTPPGLSVGVEPSSPAAAVVDTRAGAASPLRVLLCPDCHAHAAIVAAVLPVVAVAAVVPRRTASAGADSPAPAEGEGRGRAPRPLRLFRRSPLAPRLLGPAPCRLPCFRGLCPPPRVLLGRPPPLVLVFRRRWPRLVLGVAVACLRLPRLPPRLWLPAK